MLLYKTKKFSGEVYNVCGYNIETIIKDDAKEGEGKWTNTVAEVLMVKY